MSKVEDIVDKCIATGMNAVALTDHGNMYGIKDLLDYTKGINAAREKAAKESGEPFEPFKAIVGCEAYCARRGRHRRTDDKIVNAEGKTQVIDRSGWHLILLAKNMVGYHNLCRIVSAGYMTDAYYHTPRIDRELLEMYHEGLICSSACLGGELPQKIMNAFSHRPSAIGPQEAIAQGVYAEAEETVRWLRTCLVTTTISSCNATRRRSPAATRMSMSARKR